MRDGIDATRELVYELDRRHRHREFELLECSTDELSVHHLTFYHRASGVMLTWSSREKTIPSSVELLLTVRRTEMRSS